MKIKRVDLTISTNKMQESKEFYQRYFGFRLVYESDWYIELISPSDPSAGISFTLPQREVGEFFNGKGLIISFEVDHGENGALLSMIQTGRMYIFISLLRQPPSIKSFMMHLEMNRLEWSYS
ncbi:MAG: Glyoxalase-like domain containing protein [Firmicutes bacterium]|nr:Glyoxalase-like domain containing protein [Bacillota bacterium]